MYLLLLIACGTPSSPPDTAPRDSSPVDTSPVGGDPCVDPVAILDAAGQSTGYSRCDDGSVDRVTAVAVNSSLYEGIVPACTPYGRDICTTDAECVEHPQGRCYQDTDMIGPYCHCTYLCTSDQDCGEGEICIAPPAVDSKQPWPVCVQAACAAATDCVSTECGLSLFYMGTVVAVGLGCRTESDACRTNADCEASNAGNHCMPGDAGWICHIAGDE